MENKTGCLGFPLSHGSEFSLPKNSWRFLLLLLDAAYFDMPDGSELRLRVPLVQLGGDHFQPFLPWNF